MTMQIKNKQQQQTFPFKLYHAIEWASNSEFSTALAWSPSGDSFIVGDREAMVEYVIPNFFDHKKWRSFTRQLNLWGFRRELRGPGSVGETYYHEHFKRGEVDHLQQIKRTEVKRPLAKKSLLASKQSVGVSVNSNPLQTGDITQGASFLTGMKGTSGIAQANLIPGGGISPITTFPHNIQGCGQISNLINAAPTPVPSSMIPSAASLQPPMLQPLMLPSQMIAQIQPQILSSQNQRQNTFQNCNWQSCGNQLSRDLFQNIPTQQLIAMASTMRGFDLSSLQPNHNLGPHVLSDSNSNMSGSLDSKPAPNLDTFNASPLANNEEVDVKQT